MIQFNSFAVVALTLGLAACSNNSSSPGPGGDISLPGNPVKPVIQAEPPAFDYSRFQYGSTGTCGQPGFYYKLLNAADVVIGKRNGQDIMVSSQILLHNDNTFEVEVDEKYIGSYTTDGYTYKQQRSRYVKGSYKEVNGDLVLGDLMEISGQDVSGKAVATIHYKKNLMSDGLLDREVSGNMVYSTSAIQSERVTCPDATETIGEFGPFIAQPDPTSLALNSFSTDAVMAQGNVSISKLELFIQADGAYQIVALVSFSGASPQSYILDDGEWERNGSTLKLYNGSANLLENGELSLQFTRDITLFAGNKSYPLSIQGTGLYLHFGPSKSNADNLSDTYR